MNFTSKQITKIAVLVQRALPDNVDDLSLQDIELALLRYVYDTSTTALDDPNKFVLDGVTYLEVENKLSTCEGCVSKTTQDCDSLRFAPSRKTEGCYQTIFIKVE